MSETTEVIEAIRAACERLSDGYLIKEKLADYRGGFCALGAVLRTGLELEGEKLWLPAPVGEAAGIALNRAGAQRCNCSAVTEFNDRPSTVKEDILAIYDRAIEILGQEKS